MTKVFNISIKEKTQDELNYSLFFGSIRQNVLKQLFQDHSIIEGLDETTILDTFPESVYREISRETNIQEFLVKSIIERFLTQLYYFREFWKNCHIAWPHEKNRIFAKMRIYLHKIYRLAPVFDYRRARTNLKIFHTFLKRENFWPRISTQLAMVIYITDMNNSRPQKRLRVQNIRLLANSSAYAFYNVRNRLINRGVLNGNE